MQGRLGEIPVAFCVSMSSVMSQRLLLNIRKNFEERSGGGLECEDETDLLTMSSPVFGTALTDMSSSGALKMMPLSQLAIGSLNASDCTNLAEGIGIEEIPVSAV